MIYINVVNFICVYATKNGVFQQQRIGYNVLMSIATFTFIIHG